ncbi:MAG TPA: hypothetical protein VJU60_11615 [Thermoleophilaceae bacterium]|nr:hypothetical protein [Thermoleophilaceae bacterium]
MQQPRSKNLIRQLRLAAVCSVAYGGAAALFMPGVWPLMPFPAVGPVEIAAALGFVFGLITRRGWTLALPLTVLVALDPPQSGIAGALIALLILWPFSAAGSVVGIGLGRMLQRQMLRRTLRAAQRRERVKKQRSAPVSAPGAASL